MTLFIGLDDTDTTESPTGTGHLARVVMDDLAACQIASYGVSRHQLLFDPMIPYTAKNSANVVHVLAGASAIPDLVERVEETVRAHCYPGSDPGLCIAADITGEIVAFGQRAKREIVTQDEAKALARRHNVFLRGLGGTNGGIIGALAGVGLASRGNDGRFTQIERSRHVVGTVPVSEVIDAGISEVQTLEGASLSEGMIDTCDRLRPSLRGGRAVLYVEQVNRQWRALRLD